MDLIFQTCASKNTIKKLKQPPTEWEKHLQSLGQETYIQKPIYIKNCCNSIIKIQHNLKNNKTRLFDNSYFILFILPHCLSSLIPVFSCKWVANPASKEPYRFFVFSFFSAFKYTLPLIFLIVAQILYCKEISIRKIITWESLK